MKMIQFSRLRKAVLLFVSVLTLGIAPLAQAATAVPATTRLTMTMTGATLPATLKITNNATVFTCTVAQVTCAWDIPNGQTGTITVDAATHYMTYADQNVYSAIYTNPAIYGCSRDGSTDPYDTKTTQAMCESSSTSICPANGSCETIPNTWVLITAAWGAVTGYATPWNVKGYAAPTPSGCAPVATLTSAGGVTQYSVGGASQPGCSWNINAAVVYGSIDFIPTMNSSGGWSNTSNYYSLGAGANTNPCSSGPLKAGSTCERIGVAAGTSVKVSSGVLPSIAGASASCTTTKTLVSVIPLKTRPYYTCPFTMPAGPVSVTLQ